jgi:hypothetical protein
MVGHLPEIPAPEDKLEDPQAVKQRPAVDDQPAPGAGDFPDDVAPKDTRVNPERKHAAEENDKAAVKYALLRFIDLKAEPGSLYRYRVQLALTNPNHDDKIKESHLAQPGLGKDPILKTAWSEPSDIIEVPDDVRVLATAATRLPAGTPDVKIEVAKWIQDTGVTAHHTFGGIARGAILDFMHVRLDPPPGSGPPPPAHPVHPHPTPRGQRPATPDTFIDYQTGYLAVDIAPDGADGQFLVFQNGTLMAHNVRDDTQIVDGIKEAEKPVNPHPVGPDHDKPHRTNVLDMAVPDPRTHRPGHP